MTTLDWNQRWSDIQKLLERSGPFTHPDFEPSPTTLKMVQENFKVLVIGMLMFNYMYMVIWYIYDILTNILCT